eukprot:4848533-Amphidinium_carterae.1
MHKQSLSYLHANKTDETLTKGSARPKDVLALVRLFLRWADTTNGPNHHFPKVLQRVLSIQAKLATSVLGASL